MAGARELFEITPEILLRAYTIGLFPMAENAQDSNLFWVDPEQRGVFPLDGLIVSRSLAKRVRSDCFEVRIDTDFDGVLDGCGEAAPGRESTWINDRIRSLYRSLFEVGHVHTVEVWSDSQLVGGLYGVAIGAAFFGESMFHRARDASKVALVHLVARLRAGRYRLLDTQFVTDHLATLGATAISKPIYHQRLAEAVARHADFGAAARSLTGAQALALLEDRTQQPGETG